MAYFPDFPALKCTTNFSNASPVHDGIVPSQSVGCPVSLRRDDNLQWLKDDNFCSPDIFNDAQYNSLGSYF